MFALEIRFFRAVTDTAGNFPIFLSMVASLLSLRIPVRFLPAGNFPIFLSVVASSICVRLLPPFVKGGFTLISAMF